MGETGTCFRRLGQPVLHPVHKRAQPRIGFRFKLVDLDLCLVGEVFQDGGCLEAGGTYGGQSVICGTIDCGNTCAADLDRDGFVTLSDLMIILASWGNCPD